MKLKTSVGQIFLTHPKDENFTSLYEEVFSKQGISVELFAVVEITGSGAVMAKARRDEYERLTQALVSAFKKTYISSSFLDEGTFERALVALNSTLSRFVTRGKADWYGKFHAVVAALFQNELTISTTGNALVYLMRKGQLNLLSENLAEGSKPVKVFSNFSSGRVYAGDRIIFSTNELINYIALDRIQEFLVDGSIEETCQEIIATLADIKNVGFATFVFEITSGETLGTITFPRPSSKITRQIPQSPLQNTEGFLKFLWIVGKFSSLALKFIWDLLTNLLGTLYALLANFFRRRSKKYIFVAIGLVLLLLVSNIGIAVWKKSGARKQSEQNSLLTKAQEKLNEAEAAMIYNDENKIVTLISEAEKLISQIGKKETVESKNLDQRLTTLKNKIKKETRIDNPTLLATYPNIPTNLLYSPEGFLGFNRNSQTLSFYDFRSGEIKAILKNQNLNSLLVGAFVEPPHDYAFFNREGKFTKLNPLSEHLNLYEAETPVIEPDTAKIQAISVLGEGNGARLYLLDTKQNQIWRLRMGEKGVVSPEKWLKTEKTQVAEALDLSVDGSVYLLYSDRVEKYFNGQRENFELSLVSPPLKKALKIFTKPAYQFLYILDQENQRVLVFTKGGKLKSQITSPKFRDLADLYVDEPNKVMYILSGSELLQINL